MQSLALDAYLWLTYWLHTLEASAAVCGRMPPSAGRAPNEVGVPMPFKPNYNQQRNERNRAKEQKKQEKLQRREEEVARRKAAREGSQSSPAGPETSQDT